MFDHDDLTDSYLLPKGVLEGLFLLVPYLGNLVVLLRILGVSLRVLVEILDDGGEHDSAEWCGLNRLTSRNTYRAHRLHAGDHDKVKILRLAQLVPDVQGNEIVPGELCCHNLVALHLRDRVSAVDSLSFDYYGASLRL